MEPALWPVLRCHHFSKKVGSVQWLQSASCWWRKVPFIRKQHPETAYQLGIRLGEGTPPFTVGSRNVNASVTCANIGAFVAAAFIPPASERVVEGLQGFLLKGAAKT